MIIVLDDTGDIFVEFVFPFRANKRCSILDGKYELEIDLNKCVCHALPYIVPNGTLLFWGIIVAINVPSLTGLKQSHR